MLKFENLLPYILWLYLWFPAFESKYIQPEHMTNFQTGIPICSCFQSGQRKVMWSSQANALFTIRSGTAGTWRNPKIIPVIRLQVQRQDGKYWVNLAICFQNCFNTFLVYMLKIAFCQSSRWRLHAFRIKNQIYGRIHLYFSLQNTQNFFIYEFLVYARKKRNGFLFGVS